MMRLCYLLFLLFLVTESGAQTLFKRFFNIEDFETDSASSYYFEMRVLSDDSNPPLISYYTATNKIRFKEGFKDEQNEKLRTYYYPNGVIKAEGVFSVAGPKGLVHTFYDNGQRQAELVYESSKDQENNEPIQGIINYWDSVGNQIIDNGQGNCQCNLSPFTDQVLIETGLVVHGMKSGEWEGQGLAGDDSFTFKESYENGKLIHGTQYRAGKIYTYDHLKNTGMPYGGMKAFYANIAENLRYPMAARKRNIQGIVYVDFVVDEAGYLQDVKVAKGIDKVCDEEAVRSVRMSPKWSPGFVRGRPVKKKMILPIIFKLRM